MANLRAVITGVGGYVPEYRLTNEELFNWQQLIDGHGLAGLRTTKTQDYRAGVLSRNW